MAENSRYAKFSVCLFKIIFCLTSWMYMYMYIYVHVHCTCKEVSYIGFMLDRPSRRGMNKSKGFQDKSCRDVLLHDSTYIG